MGDRVLEPGREGPLVALEDLLALLGEALVDPLKNSARRESEPARRDAEKDAVLGLVGTGRGLRQVLEGHRLD